MPPIASDVGPSGAVLLPLIAFGVVELALIVFCIVDIVRRPVVLGGRKWVWVVVVVVFSLIGCIVYLAIGRAQPPVSEERAEPISSGSRTAAAMDILYGRPSGAAPETETPAAQPHPARPPDAGEGS